MKTRHLIPFLICCFLLTFSHAMAQDERFDAWYYSIVKDYTLNPDGSMDYSYSKQQKLLTYRAFHNLYGETFVAVSYTHLTLPTKRIV